jgi:uncharacterized protein
VTVIHRAEYRTMPWKNGAGVTEEIERFPVEGRYAWRLSRAHVAKDGPFSVFAGYDRWLVVSEGEGLTLNETTTLRPFDVHRFKGDDVTQCRLIKDEVWDLGFIFDPNRVAAEMTVVRGPQPLHLQGDIHYLFAAQGASEIDGHHFNALDTLKQVGRALLQIRRGCWVVITMTFLDPSLRANE